MTSVFHTLTPSGLLVRFALPNVVSMAFFSIYIVIDGIFIGKYLGESALAAFALVMPFVMMGFALADMIALGSSVQITMKLGRGKVREARGIFSSCIVIIVALACGIGLLEYFVAPFFIALLNTSAEIKSLCVESMRVFAVFAPITMLSFALDNYLRICNKSHYAMAINIVISLSNIFFDYLFIVVFGWGLYAAALATCIGLSLGGILGLAPFLTQRLTLRFVPLFLRFKIFRNILYNGSSEFFNNISSALYAILANAVLLNISGIMAVAAFSVISYIDSFITALLIAANDGMQPALSYNYARRDTSRIRGIMKAMLLVAGIFALGMFGVTMILGEKLVGFFSDKDSEFIAFAAFALKLFVLNYLINWFNILCGGFLTAFNKPRASLILSLSQNLIVPLIFLMILPRFWGVSGVWITPFCAELCVVFMAIYLLKKTMDSLK